jgi:hypothetical protein
MSLTILLFIAQFQYLSAQPWSKDLCISPGLYGIIVSTKSRFRRLGMRQIRSLRWTVLGSLTAALRAGVEVGRVPREGPAKD